MRKLGLLVLLISVLGIGNAQPPAKLFDVRNGNGVIDGANTDAFATLIVFKDQASKQSVIDAFCKVGGWQALIGGVANPQSKPQFFHSELQKMIRDRVIQGRGQTAHEAVVVDTSDIP